MILTGGWDEKDITHSCVFALEVATGKWKLKDTLPSLNNPRTDHGSCAVGDALYVVGGTDNKGDSYTIEILGMRVKDDLSFATLKK